MRRIIYILFAMTVAVSCARSKADTAKGRTEPEKDLVDAAVLAVPAERVYFPFASDLLLPEASEAIDANAEWMQKEKDTYIILEGHCDEVGDSDFNVQLGDRRARAVKAYMMEKGISAERIIMVVSYGSARPLNPGHEIEDLRQNRRVEFVLR